MPRAEQHEALVRSLQVNTGLAHDTATEAVILGRWLITECGGPVQGMDRLSRRLWKLRGAEGFAPLMSVIRDVATSGATDTAPRQKAALDALARAFRVA